MQKKPKRARPRLTQVIAERELRLVTKGRRRTKILLQFGKPRLCSEDGSYICVFQVEGLEGQGTVSRHAAGEDSVQALYLTMQMALMELVTTRAYREGRLTYLGRLDLGLPVHEGISALIRKDRAPRPRASARRTPKHAGRE